MEHVKPDEIKDLVEKVKIFINTPEMIKLKEDNYVLYDAKVQKEFEKFHDEYPTLLKIIAKGSDLAFLDKMLNMITKINNNEIEKMDGEKQLGEELAEQYIYPVIKDQKPLSEKELKKRQQMEYK